MCIGSQIPKRFELSDCRNGGGRMIEVSDEEIDADPLLSFVWRRGWEACLEYLNAKQANNALGPIHVTRSHSENS